MEILHIFLTVSRYSEGRILQGNIPTEFESGYKQWESLRHDRGGLVFIQVRSGAASPQPVRITWTS